MADEIDLEDFLHDVAVQLKALADQGEARAARVEEELIPRLDKLCERVDELHERLVG